MDILFANSAETEAPFYLYLIMLTSMFLIFYFIVIRPQSKEKKKRQDELDSLTKGDRVLSNGGIVGKIVEFQGKEKQIVVLDTEFNSKLKIQKSFILKKIIIDKKTVSK